MRKKIVYVGIAVLLAGLLAYFYVYSSISSAISASSTQVLSRVYKNFTLQQASYGVINFTGTAPNISAFVVEANKSVDVSLLNASAYALWGSSISSNKSAYGYAEAARSLEGRGAILLYENVTNATYPYTYAQPAYATNNTNATFGILPIGRYYIIVNGHNSSEGQIAVNSIVVGDVSVAENYDTLKSIGLLSVVAVLLFVIGLIIIIVGLFRKDKNKQGSEMSQEAIDKLYSGIRNTPTATERHAKQKPKGKKHNR